MNCLLLSVILILSVLSYVNGRIVNFSLITFGRMATVTVPSLNQTIALSPVDDFSGVQSASTICPDEQFEYYYSIDGLPEGFTRVLPVGQLTTHNEFIGRQETIRKLLGMGYPADKPQWTRSIGKTELFDDSYIPTVIIDSSSRDYFARPYNYTTGVAFDRFTVISMDKIFSDVNVESKPKNRYQEKIQFRVKLQHNLFKRKIFKFRPCGAEDPAVFREALYGDVVAAVGNPVHNQVFVRVYLSDGTAVGFYLMIEVSSSKSFIKNQFYGDVALVDEEDDEAETKSKVKSEHLGSIYDCATGADFIEGSNFLTFKNKDDPSDSKSKLQALTSAMHSLDVFNPDEVQKFSKEWLDLDTFFKALALEYLAGHWDSYWMDTCNYVLYNDPFESTDSTYKFYFVDQDFDQTFGVGFPSRYNPSQSFRELIDSDNKEAIAVFLKEGSITRGMFEQHLKDIVQHVFNPVALGRRLEQYTSRYDPEIKWNFAEKIERLDYDNAFFNTKYHTNHYTYDDYSNNVEYSPVLNSTHYGLKQWIETRATVAAEDLQIEWDQVPLDPVERPIVKKVNTKKFNKIDVEKKSGATMTKTINTTSVLVVALVLFIGLLM